MSSRRSSPRSSEVHPELSDRFERKLIQFRDFAPRERDPQAWNPRPGAAEEETAAAAGRRTGRERARGRPAWRPPIDDAAGGRGAAGRPGMPTHLVPPWAGRREREPPRRPEDVAPVRRYPDSALPARASRPTTRCTRAAR